jgi:two-component system, OmpR family, sensor histidine kinase KdpD
LSRETRRRTPEELLDEVQALENAQRKGRLKIFLGYASGVGKSSRMLDEACRRQERGQDVVVGAIQPLVSPEAQPYLERLEVIPLQTDLSGAAIDVERIMRRSPAVCVIDGLAYDNPPGLPNATRWQDVEQLLTAGVSVITSINIQYIEELRAQVSAITGKNVTETVPVSFIKSADEIVIVDVPAEESMERSPEEQVEVKQRQQRLSRLRELALVLAADVVDHQLISYLRCHGIQHHLGTHERLLICITPHTNVRDMFLTGRMVADRFHGELLVTYVRQDALSATEQAALDERLSLAESIGASVKILEGGDPVEVLLEFAQSHGITQLFVGHSRHTGVLSRFWSNPVAKLIRHAQGMDVRVFPQ